LFDSAVLSSGLRERSRMKVSMLDYPRSVYAILELIP
jgi:hypothetical protein